MYAVRTPRIEGPGCSELRIGAKVLILLTLVGLVVAHLPTSLRAQLNDRLAFETFSEKEGLSNYSITTILRDQRGFLWVGTQAGLNRYDGSTFSGYTAENSVLSGDFITALFEDRRGIIWIGTQNAGLYRFDPRTEQFTQYARNPENPASLSHNDIRAIYEDSRGILWIGTRGGGLNRFDRSSEKFTQYPVGAHDSVETSRDTVWAIQSSGPDSGVLWIGTEKGLSRVAVRDDSSGRLRRSSQQEMDPRPRISDPVRALHANGSGRMWIGTQSSGLYALDISTGSLEQLSLDSEDSRSRGSNTVLTIHEDPSGILWIGTAGTGLRRLDPSTGRMTRHENVPGNNSSLPNDEVRAVLVDRTGVLWAGTWGGLGKHVFAQPGITHYTHREDDPNSLSHPSVASIYEDRSGTLWVGTLGGGLNRIDRETNRVTRFDLPFSDVIAICEDRSGSLWLGTRDNSVYRFDRETENVTEFPLDPRRESHPEDIVLTIYEPPSQPDLLWIGTKRNGVYVFDTQSRETLRNYRYDPKDSTSLSDSYAWPICEDHTGTLWVGTWGGGLNRFDRTTGTFDRFLSDRDEPSTISGNRVISIGEDRSGTLWVGTADQGLNAFDRATGRFTRYSEEDGLPDDDIAGILGDERGYLWLSTNSGLSRFDPRTEAAVHFGVADGLQERIFRFGAVHKNSQGHLFFGGENGLNVIYPDRIRIRKNPPPVVLTAFHLFGEPARLDSSIWAAHQVTLDYDQNYVGFEFAVLDFKDPARNQYAYKLEGVDTDWIEAGNQRSVRYPNLAPGTYTFRVKGANSNNLWNESGASVRLIITPPWWQTTWAYLLYGVALISIVYGGYRWRVRHLKKRAHELTRRVERATEDLREEKRKTEKQAERLLELEQVKDRFFANISHEFRTPLTLILGPIEDALSGTYGALDPELRKRLEAMRRNGERLRRLINELLDLSKLEIGGMQLQAREGDLTSYVEEVTLSFSPLADRKGLSLQCQAAPDSLYAYFDPDKLEKILANLLSNALKFTPEGGKVRVTVDEIKSSEPAGSSAEICIQDTGRGISEEELPHIFDRFYQIDTSASRPNEGTGIGLALTKELVELHGGTIEVESEEGFGTTFCLRLPLGAQHLDPDDLADGDLETEVSPSDKPVEIAGYSAAETDFDTSSIETDLDGESGSQDSPAPTILLVDDSADIRSYLRSHLSPRYEIAEASDGKEGLAKAQNIEPDLVISDVMMPEVDGIELCRSLKEDEQLEHIPVILLTAKATDDSAIEGLKTGADDYIQKPFNADVVVARVENLIDVRRRLRQRFSDQLRIGPSEISVPSEEEAFLERVREVVEEHMGDSNFGVEWFADEVGMSRRHLHRKLRETVDLSPASYVRMMRLERAAQLLEQRAGTVAEVAYQVGFKNADHFSRVFQQAFDVPPSEYPTD